MARITRSKTLKKPEQTPNYSGEGVFSLDGADRDEDEDAFSETTRKRRSAGRGSSGGTRRKRVKPPSIQQSNITFKKNIEEQLVRLKPVYKSPAPSGSCSLQSKLARLGQLIRTSSVQCDEKLISQVDQLMQYANFKTLNHVDLEVLQILKAPQQQQQSANDTELLRILESNNEEQFRNFFKL